MKGKYIRVIILSLIFVAAVFVFSMFTNKGNTDMTADMEAATLPTISFNVADKDVNLLNGHKQEMVFSAMRDTITPINADGTLTVNIQSYGQSISSLQYEVYSVDGSEKILSGTETGLGEQLTLAIGDILAGREGILRIQLNVDENSPVYYLQNFV